MDKKGFVWYLFQQEMIFLGIGLLVGLIVGYLLVTDVIPLSKIFTICKAGT